MEVAGAVTRRALLLLPCPGLDSSDRRKPCLAAPVNVKNPGSKSGDRGSGNHRLTITCGEKKKEKRKLVKGLEKDLETFAAMGFGIDPRSGLAGKVHGCLMKEAAEVLLRHLQWLRQAEEEAKRRRKQEKKRKSKSMRKLEDTASVEPQTESGDHVCKKLTDFNTCWADRFLSSTRSSSSVELLEASNISRLAQEALTQPAATDFMIPASLCQRRKRASADSAAPDWSKESGSMHSPNVRLSTSNAAPAIRSGVQICDVDAVMSSFLQLK